jgi:ABC-2 type transport system ATP-binding protein
MTVLLSTPYMDEAERCHRVGLIHHGRLLLDGEPHALLATFEDEAFEVEGGEREQVDERLASLAEVHAASPAGSTLRIALARGSAGTVAAALQPLHASLRPVAPNFEDLFLARVRQEASA